MRTSSNSKRNIRNSQETSTIKSWTFQTEEIATTFDNHVREQLPWYDLATEAVTYIIRNYLPQNGKITDIGASTGNMYRKLKPLMKERQTTQYVAIDNSKKMLDEMKRLYTADYSTKLSLVHEDIVKLPETIYKDSNVIIVFLTLMFIEVKHREELINKLRNNLVEGGCIIIVDKILDHDGYFGTVIKRLGMHFKLMQGAKPEDVLAKEMSLAGVQTPLDKNLLIKEKMFFRMGEFAGWIIEG
jgi:tRNA (cmo5U34)-methyltransferase